MILMDVFVNSKRVYVHEYHEWHQMTVSSKSHQGKEQEKEKGGGDGEKRPEAKLVNMYLKIKEGDMGREYGPGKLDRMVTIEMLKEKKKEIIAMGLQ